jgi:hypothetical protein
MRTVSRIKKRDGDVVDFVQDKITNAVFNAMQAHGQEDKRVAQSISDIVSFMRIHYPVRREYPGYRRDGSYEAGISRYRKILYPLQRKA